MARTIAISQPSLGEIVLDLFNALKIEEKTMVKRAILEKAQDWDSLTQPMRKYTVQKSLKEKDILDTVMKDRYGKN